MKGKHVKKYVRVNSDFDQKGNLFPRSISLDDGKAYRIDCVKSIRYSLSPDSFQDDCYTVVINGQTTHLFFEKSRSYADDHLGRWFVILRQKAPLSKQNEGRGLNVYSFPKGKDGQTAQGRVPSAQTV